MNSSRIVFFLFCLLVLHAGHTEEQIQRVANDEVQESGVACSSIRDKLKKECRSIGRFSKSIPQSDVLTLEELNIKETISITSSVKLPEDI